MSKRTTAGILVAGLLLAVLIAGISTVDWNEEYTEPQYLPTFDYSTPSGESIWDADGELNTNSLPYAVFEQYGFVLIPLAVLMFGAMVGGVVISREEVEE